MSDNDLDAVAEMAVQKLADLLAAELGTEVQDAASRALGKVSRELESRAGQIETATQGVVGLLESMGDEMRSQTQKALRDGMQSQVLPALEREGERVAVATAAQLSNTLREQLGVLEDALSTTTQLLHQGIAGATSEIAKRGGETTEETRKRIASTEKTLREQIDQQGSVLRTEFPRLAQRLESVEKNGAGELAAAEVRLEKRLKHLQDTLSDVRQETAQQAGVLQLKIEAGEGRLAETLKRNLAIEDDRFRKLRRSNRILITLLILLIGGFLAVYLH